MMQHGGHSGWRWKVPEDISGLKCLSSAIICTFYIVYINHKSIPWICSYSLEEEIELLSAIYIHELTVESEKER